MCRTLLCFGSSNTGARCLGGAGGVDCGIRPPGRLLSCACPAPWRFFADAWHRHIPPAFDGVHFTSEGHRRFIREPEGPLRQIFPG